MSTYRHSKRTTAYLLMCRIAGRMDPDYGKRTDPVTRADLRTSMQDARAAFSIAVDGDVMCDRNGYRSRRAA